MSAIFVFIMSVLIGMWVMQKTARIKARRLMRTYVAQYKDSEEYRELMRTGKIPKGVLAIRNAIDLAKRKDNDKAGKLGVSLDD